MTKPRFELTDEEHERFTEIGNEFWRKLGKLVAEALDDCPAPDLEDLLLMHLGDRCSVYGAALTPHRRKR